MRNSIVEKRSEKGLSYFLQIFTFVFMIAACATSDEGNYILGLCVCRIFLVKSGANGCSASNGIRSCTLTLIILLLGYSSL